MLLYFQGAAEAAFRDPGRARLRPTAFATPGSARLGWYESAPALPPHSGSFPPFASGGHGGESRRLGCRGCVFPTFATGPSSFPPLRKGGPGGYGQPLPRSRTRSPVYQDRRPVSPFHTRANEALPTPPRPPLAKGGKEIGRWRRRSTTRNKNSRRPTALLSRQSQLFTAPGRGFARAAHSRALTIRIVGTGLGHYTVGPRATASRRVGFLAHRPKRVLPRCEPRHWRKTGSGGPSN